MEEYEDPENQNSNEEEQDDVLLNDPAYQDFLSSLMEEKDAINMLSIWGDDSTSTLDDGDDDSAELDFLLHDDSISEDERDFVSMFLPKLKSKTVNYDAVSGKIKSFISGLPEELKNKIVVTSGADGTHSKNSKHYGGDAIDLRYDPTLHDYIRKNAGNFGLRTINPNHGTAPHTHLEVMQYGGYDYGSGAYTQLDQYGNPIYRTPSHQPNIPKYDVDPAYLNNKFNTSVTQEMTSSPYKAGSYTPSSDPDYSSSSSGSDIAGAANVATQSIGGIMEGFGKLDEFMKKRSQRAFELADSGLTSAIQILGERQQNLELRRLQKQRSEQFLNYTNYTPQVKNIPAYL